MLVANIKKLNQCDWLDAPKASDIKGGATSKHAKYKGAPEIAPGSAVGPSGGAGASERKRAGQSTSNIIGGELIQLSLALLAMRAGLKARSASSSSRATSS